MGGLDGPEIKYNLLNKPRYWCSEKILLGFHSQDGPVAAAVWVYFRKELERFPIWWSQSRASVAKLFFSKSGYNHPVCGDFSSAFFDLYLQEQQELQSNLSAINFREFYMTVYLTKYKPAHRNVEGTYIERPSRFEIQDSLFVESQQHWDNNGWK